MDHHDHHQQHHHSDVDTKTMAMPSDAPMMNHEHLHMGMSMFFHFGVQESAILFKFWSISTMSGLLLSMGLIFLASISHEGIKFYRNRLEKSRRAKYLTVGGAEAGGPKPPSSDTIAQIIPSDVRTVNPRVSRLSLEHILATLVYGIQVTLSLCLMLVFMTYNVWLCLAMVLGSCVGYFFFNDGSPADAEFCH